MRQVCIYLIVVCFCSSVVSAQEFKGIVFELGSDKPLQDVQVLNLSSQETIKSNALGYFSIPAALNSLLVFASPGYRTDTLVITDFSLKRVYLTPASASTLLQEVNITALSDMELEQAIEDAENKRKAGGATGSGLWISPSRIFGKEVQEIRTLHQVLVHERESRVIFTKFTPERIQSLTPLEGRELDLFMVKYLPSYTFIQGADEQALNLYIMDAYTSFKQLDPAELNQLKLQK